MPKFSTVFNVLLKSYGPQHWWPGETPFEVMVGAILTQNTAWLNVEKAISNLKAADALDAETLARVPQPQLAAWLQPSGYFNIKSRRIRNFCIWYLEQGGYRALQELDTQTLRHALLTVNGVGAETADDILLYAFRRPVFVIDAYTRRIFSRLGMVDADAGYESLRHGFETALGKETQGHTDLVALYNEYHALIVRHGKEVCRSRPRCGQCRLARYCFAKSALEQ